MSENRLPDYLDHIQQAAADVDPGQGGETVQCASRIGDQVSGRKQAADPGCHIGDCALEGHEGGALMGGRNGRRDR